MKPRSWWTNIFLPFGSTVRMNAAMISHCTGTMFSLVASTMTMWMVVHCAKGNNVSKQLIPSLWQMPQIQKGALNFLINPSRKRSILKAQVNGRMFIHGLCCTSFYASISSKVSKLNRMAAQHSSWKKPLMVSSYLGVSLIYLEVQTGRA